MYLEFKPITANNIATFNAYVTAVRCDGFIKFAKFYDNELPALFKNVTIFKTKKDKKNDADVFALEEKEIEDKGKDLSICYGSLQVRELKEAYEQVVRHREQEFASVFTEKEIEFNNLEELEKVKYQLLFYYGEKLGGYLAIASLDIKELLNIYKFFAELQDMQNKSSEELLKKQ